MKKRWQRVRGLDGSITSIDDDTLVVVALSIEYCTPISERKKERRKIATIL